MDEPKTIAAVAIGSSILAGFGLYMWHEKRKAKKKRNEGILEQIVHLLDQKNCYIKDIAILRNKLRKFINDGHKKMQIITDFDRTLTKAFIDGQPAHASYGVVDDSAYIPESAVQELNNLKKKYLPIEMSTSLTEAEKLPHIIEWYTQAYNVAVKSSIKRHMLPTMVRESSVELRDGCDQFFRLITEKTIPIFIMSAGMGDIIEEILKQQAQIPPHLKLVANFYSYDSEGIVNGRRGELIHTFNKNDVSKNSSNYFDKIKNCTNVILMGDTLGDPVMADGVEYMEEVIKIGFLNKDIEESLDGYLAAYDIVLADNASMDIITLLLDQLTKNY